MLVDHDPEHVRTLRGLAQPERVRSVTVSHRDLAAQDLDEVADAVQNEDVRSLIDSGIITAKPIVGTSRSRARKASQQKSKGRRKGQGSRSGSANARSPRKQRWMTRIRAQRRVLRELREEESLTSSQYRHFYLKAKGGSYRSIAHMRSNIELDGIAAGGEQ